MIWKATWCEQGEDAVDILSSALGTVCLHVQSPILIHLLCVLRIFNLPEFPIFLSLVSRVGCMSYDQLLRYNTLRLPPLGAAKSYVNVLRTESRSFDLTCEDIMAS